LMHPLVARFCRSPFGASRRPHQNASSIYFIIARILNNHNTAAMIRQDFARIDPKRRTGLDHRKKQFATPTYQTLQYQHRLNFYVTPPTTDITLEQFEQWAIDRLRGMTYCPRT